MLKIPGEIYKTVNASKIIYCGISGRISGGILEEIPGYAIAIYQENFRLVSWGAFCIQIWEGI